MRKHGKVDRNQPAIVETLRRVGAIVVSLAPIGGGVPDLLVLFRGDNYLLEVKMDDGKLTPDQEVWIEAAQRKGRVAIVRSEDDALKAIGAI